MEYREIQAGSALREYVKCYYIYESQSEKPFQDTVFPSGCMEIIFNLGGGTWQIERGGTFSTTPLVELWGQIIKPLAVRSVGKNTMLGIRFYPHAAAYFMENEIDAFNNQVVDFAEEGGSSVRMLYARLMESDSWNDRINLLEHFLLNKFSLNMRRTSKLALVHAIMGEMMQPDFFENIDSVAGRYGITSRYLQKLFVQTTGLTPKLYSKIHRFQHSLKLVTRKDTSLTNIAYHCGYFDQSHFIREFKSFTGLTPSGYMPANFPITFASVK